jgi:hypothetical protein
MSNRVICADYLVAATGKKLYFGKFKSGGLHENHAVATGNLGNIRAFASRQKKTMAWSCSKSV